MKALQDADIDANILKTWRRLTCLQTTGAYNRNIDKQLARNYIFICTANIYVRMYTSALATVTSQITLLTQLVTCGSLQLKFPFYCTELL